VLHSRGRLIEVTGQDVEQTISGQLKSVVQRCGERNALIAPDYDPLPYAGLFEQVANVVDALNDLGVGRGDRVVLVLPDGPKMAAAFLGVAAGAVCAPLNPGYRRSEFISFCLSLKPKAMIVEAEDDSAAVIAAERLLIPILRLVSQGNGPSYFTLRGEKLAPAARRGFAVADDTALLLFTSGTTARAKLVPLTHANLLASSHDIAATLQLSPDDRCLNIMPLFHIHGLVGGLLASLISGASVVCPDRLQAQQFFHWLKEFRPTWYSAVPTMHRAILADGQANVEIVRQHSLRFIRSSSAPLPSRVMEDLEEFFGAPVIEAYGMTEATHQITSNPLPPLERKRGSVGTSTGTKAAVMDESGNFAAPGEIGEIVLRGANVTPGYEGDKEANQKAFTRGWFRTGDQGYLDADGYLFLTGRIKEMINRGGEKISPYEVDKALLDHRDIVEAVTFAVAHPSLGEDIAAAVVVRDKDRVTEEMIREYLLSRLVEFKIPSRLLIVDHIPKSATGKVERGLLTEFFKEQLKGDFVAPENEIESKLVRIYAEVLGLDKVGTNDNFFALGGDSLRAGQIIARVRSIFGVNLSMATIFWKSTVADLSREIHRIVQEAEVG
jgi:acyl-CoA synthetase (AMP-forming)/AMP-acid ligase II/acyl carrier protein